MSQRITIRLDDALYDRLHLFAQGRSHGRTPEVSEIVREAIAQYLSPKARQTQARTWEQNVRHGGTNGP